MVVGMKTSLKRMTGIEWKCGGHLHLEAGSLAEAQSEPWKNHNLIDTTHSLFFLLALQQQPILPCITVIWQDFTS